MLYKELRVGNLVQTTDSDNWNPFARKATVEVTVSRLQLIEASKTLYEPIPLTAEWLERLGFEGNINDGYALNGVELDYLTTENDFHFGYGIRNAKRGIAWIFIEIKYVHQLQNLFFSLTGEELTVK